MATITPHRSDRLASKPTASSEESIRHQPTAPKHAKDLPPSAPIALPEGAASSSKHHGRPPKVAPLCVDHLDPRVMMSLVQICRACCSVG